MPLQHPLVVGLAEKYKKSPAQIVLRWLIQRQIVVIPKSVTPSRIQENAQVSFYNIETSKLTSQSQFLNHVP